MLKLSAAFVFTALGLVCTAQAQSSPGTGDMSRYESIYESPKAARNRAPTPSVTVIERQQRVETIGPAPLATYGSAKSMGISSTPAPVVRQGIAMQSGGFQRVGPGIVDKIPAQPAVSSNADMPVPQHRTTEMTTEDAQGNVIGRSIIMR